MKPVYLMFIFLFPLFVFSQISKNVELLYHWDDPAIPGSLWYNNKYNDVWGFTINGREFAVIGSTNGVHFFDITHPDSSHIVGFVGGQIQGSSIIHRDFHDYNGYLYIVADEGNSTLQIVDLHYLPDSLSVVYDSDQLIIQSHNIFIDTATAKLYACAMDDMSGSYAMNIYSLANPVNPTLLYSYNDVGHVHDVFVKNDTAYCNAGNDALRVVNFSILGQHQEIGSLTSYTDQGYNHSGWLSDDGKIYVFTDENHGYDIKVCDVSDIADIKVLSLINSGALPDSSMAHNVMIKDSFLFISYYHDGIQIYNISDPTAPVNVGYFDTYLPGDHYSYRGAWGVYSFLPSGNVLISDMQTGMYLFNVDSILLDSSKVPAPVAGFTYLVNDLVVNFYDNSINNPKEWLWDFGDGSAQSIFQNPSHIYSSQGGYVVCLTASNNGGFDTFCDTLNLPVNIADESNSLNQDNIVLFPNPALGQLFINSAKLKSGPHLLEIFNVMGEVVFTTDFNSDEILKIDLTDINTGSYIIKIRGENACYISKIIKTN